jgi:ABC-type lipopolysaccharide export system ATPase subunit
MRWDQSFIVPASPTGERGAFEVNQFLEQVSPKEILLENPFDTLIIDNWRMLHGRSSAPVASNREVERVYLGLQQ